MSGSFCHAGDGAAASWTASNNATIRSGSHGVTEERKMPGRVLTIRRMRRLFYVLLITAACGKPADRPVTAAAPQPPETERVLVGTRFQLPSGLTVIVQEN